MTGKLLKIAIDEAYSSLLSLKGHEVFRNDSSSRYTKEPIHNLIDNVSIDDCWDDLVQGDGNELVDSPSGPAKFCAAHSSSALAVNVFSPFRRAPSTLSLNGLCGFGEAQFERKCPTGLRGTSPNLDFLALGDDLVVGVESKFLELLRPKPAVFSSAYEQVIAQAGEGWQHAFTILSNEPKHFELLDAAQLVKHSLGLLHTFRNSVERIVLLYLYWEPSNADELAEYIQHRQELVEFSRLVAGDKVDFVYLSYPELWDQWEDEASWTGMPAHLDSLRERYAFPLPAVSG